MKLSDDQVNEIFPKALKIIEKEGIPNIRFANAISVSRAAFSIKINGRDGKPGSFSVDQKRIVISELQKLRAALAFLP